MREISVPSLGEHLSLPIFHSPQILDRYITLKMKYRIKQIYKFLLLSATKRTVFAKKSPVPHEYVLKTTIAQVTCMK